MRSDRYHQYGLSAADEPFRRAVRDGFRQAGLSHRQFLDALTWYRDNVRAGMDATELSASFHDFATARAWPVENLIAAQGVHQAIQQSGPETVIATPTPEEDQATIAKANELLAKDSAAYFADEQLQELMIEALERQQAAPPATSVGPAPTDTEIERRMGQKDVDRFEQMMRERPQEYWASPRHQADYRAAIERANLAEPEVTAPVAPALAPAPAPVAAAVPATPAVEPAPAAAEPVPIPIAQGVGP
jgi:hypothetical protein